MRSIILPVLFLSACASQLPSNVPVTERKDPVAVEAKFAGSEVGAQYVVQVKFSKGKTKLSAKEQKDILHALKQANDGGGVDSVQLVAWADQASAPLQKGTLPKPEQDLAEARLKEMQAALGNQLDQKKINAHNMAQSPSKVEKWLNTSDFRLKQALESAGVSDTQKQGTINLASKGLVLVFVKP